MMMIHRKDWTGGTASVFQAIGASNHSSTERQTDDYYATHPFAGESLLEQETFTNRIWEPACGGNHLVNVFREHGKEVYATDIVDRGCCDAVQDFLNSDVKEWQGDIITNPPYSHAQEFVEKALSIVPQGNKVVMFLKLTFLEGKSRKAFFKDNPPKRIWVSSSRIPCAKNGDFDSVNGSAVAYAWFVWVKGYKGSPSVGWFN